MVTVMGVPDLLVLHELDNVRTAQGELTHAEELGHFEFHI